MRADALAQQLVDNETRAGWYAEERRLDGTGEALQQARDPDGFVIQTPALNRGARELTDTRTTSMLTPSNVGASARACDSPRGVKRASCHFQFLYSASLSPAPPSEPPASSTARLWVPAEIEKRPYNACVHSAAAEAIKGGGVTHLARAGQGG